MRQYHRFTFSAITRYEIIRGFKQQNATTQLTRFGVFCGNSIILPLDEPTFDRASDLWAFARTNGHAANDADLLIAATALQHGLTLVTRNVDDVRRTGVALLNPFASD